MPRCTLHSRSPLRRRCELRAARCKCKVQGVKVRSRQLHLVCGGGTGFSSTCRCVEAVERESVSRNRRSAWARAMFNTAAEIWALYPSRWVGGAQMCTFTLRCGRPKPKPCCRPVKQLCTGLSSLSSAIVQEPFQHATVPVGDGETAWGGSLTRRLVLSRWFT